MDTSPHARPSRRRSRPSADAGAGNDRHQPARSANDAVWWVVHHQGALDYQQSIGAADQAPAPRRDDPVRTVADVPDRDRASGPRHR
jgi:hypothetical protein